MKSLSTVAIFLLLTLALRANARKTNCPEQDGTFDNWDAPETWPNGAVPIDKENVVITKPILLNTETASLSGLTLKDGGRLVFSPDAEKVKLTSAFVLIADGGRLEIGGANCSFDKRADIELTGKRDDSLSTEKFGQKFIGVDEGGVLEIHGPNRLSWTKLTSTLQRTSKAYEFHIGDRLGWQYGYEMREFNARGELRNTFVARRLLSEIETALKSFAPDSVVIINKYVGNRYDAAHCELRKMFNSILGIDSIIEDLEEDYFQAYVLIVDLANPSNFIEKTGKLAENGEYEGYRTDLAELSVGEFKFLAQAYSRTEDNKGSLDVFVETYHEEMFESTLNLLDDASTWRAGDRLFVASTDYDYEQAEEFEIKSVNGKQVTIKGQVKFDHFGEVYEGVDMRAEVGLLTRDIKIYGKMEEECYKIEDLDDCKDFKMDTFGGHTKAIKGFKSYNIEGAELFNLGQAKIVGSYPIHYHMCEDTDTVASPLVKNNAIHDTFSRCVTIHGSHGVRVVDNVAFNHNGHCYFLEDGGEKRTHLERNLGAGTRVGKLTDSDKIHPTTFWITSPLTTMIDNVAAGSQRWVGVGIWYLFPDQPVGPSKGLGFFEEFEAKRTPILEFRNNVAHSNGHNGLSFNRRLGESHEILGCSTYDPKVDPKNEGSESLPIVMNGLTAYKNTFINAVIRSTAAELTNFRLSDSLVGFKFDRNMLGGYQRLSNSTIIGESINRGYDGHVYYKKDGKWAREEVANTQPLPHSPEFNVDGVEIHAEGPSHLEDIKFIGFRHNKFRKATAIRWNDNYLFHNGVTTSAKGLSFDFSDPVEAYKMLNPSNETGRGEISIMITDLDGTLTGTENAVTAAKDVYFMNGADGCTDRPEWNMQTCSGRFGKMYVVNVADPSQSSFLTVESGDVVDEEQPEHMRASYTVPEGSTSVLHWNTTLPDLTLKVAMTGLNRDDQVIVGLCLPTAAAKVTENAHFLRIETEIAEAASMEELKSDASKNIWYDRAKGILYRKFSEDRERSESDLSDCIGGLRGLDFCPFVQVFFTVVPDIDMNEGDCRNR